VVCEIAMLDGSLGWLAAMFNAAAYEVAGLLDNLDADALVAADYTGEGSLTLDYRLSGQWDSVVGALYADWLLLPADDGSGCRVLVPRSSARVEPADCNTGLSAAGICDVTISKSTVDERYVARTTSDRIAVIAGAGAAAAVVGSADGVWKKHVDYVRTRLATSYGGEEATEEAAAQVAWAASDIDAAKLQIAVALQTPDDLAVATWAFRQAVGRACGAADRLLENSRHALDAADAVTLAWRDVQAGSRLAAHVLNARCS